MITERRWDDWDNYLLPDVQVCERFAPGIVEIMINDIEPGDRIKVRSRIGGQVIGVEAVIDEQGNISEVEGMRVRNAMDFSGGGVTKRVEVLRNNKVVFLFEDVKQPGLFVWLDQNIL